MKTTLYLKRIDLYLQVLCCVPMAGAMINHLLLDWARFACVVLAGMQIISCIVNGVALEYYQKHKSRIAYQYVLAGITMLATMAWIFRYDPLTAVLYYLLMAAAPLLAGWYMWMSYKETKFARSLANRQQFVNI